MDDEMLGRYGVQYIRLKKQKKMIQASVFSLRDDDEARRFILKYIPLY